MNRGLFELADRWDGIPDPIAKLWRFSSLNTDQSTFVRVDSILNLVHHSVLHAMFQHAVDWERNTHDMDIGRLQSGGYQIPSTVRETW